MAYLARKHLLMKTHLLFDPTSGHLIKAGYHEPLIYYWPTVLTKMGTSMVDKATAISAMQADAWTGSNGAAYYSYFFRTWHISMAALRFDTQSEWNQNNEKTEYFVPEGAFTNGIFANIDVVQGSPTFRLGFTTTASDVPVTDWSWVTSSPYNTCTATGQHAVYFPFTELLQYFWLFLYFDDPAATQQDDTVQFAYPDSSYGRIIG